jgi:hypothetical protein
MKSFCNIVRKKVDVIQFAEGFASLSGRKTRNSSQIYTQNLGFFEIVADEIDIMSFILLVDIAASDTRNILRQDAGIQDAGA